MPLCVETPKIQTVRPYFILSGLWQQLLRKHSPVSPWRWNPTLSGLVKENKEKHTNQSRVSKFQTMTRSLRAEDERSHMQIYTHICHVTGMNADATNLFRRHAKLSWSVDWQGFSVSWCSAVLKRLHNGCYPCVIKAAILTQWWTISMWNGSVILTDSQIITQNHGFHQLGSVLFLYFSFHPVISFTISLSLSLPPNLIISVDRRQLFHHNHAELPSLHQPAERLRRHNEHNGAFSSYFSGIVNGHREWR